MAAVLAGSAPTSRAATTYYWDGSGDNGGVGASWDAANSWSTDPASPDVGSAIPLAGDIAAFGITTLPAGVLHKVHLNGNREISGLVFLNTAAVGFGFALLGGDGDHTLRLGADGISAIKVGSVTPGPVTIGSAIAGQKVHLSLTASQTWASSTVSQALYVLNDVTLANSGNQTLTLAGTNTGTKIDGSISDGAGVLSLLKTESGTWNLNGPSTFSGGVMVTQGTIGMGSASAIGTGLLTLGATTGTTAVTIDNSGTGTLALTTNNEQVWNQNFTYGATSNRDLSLGTGNVSLGSASGATRTVTVNNAGTLTVGGVIRDGDAATTPTVNLVKTGTGTLALGGLNAYTGTNTITQGTLSIGSTANLGGLAGGNALIFNGGALGVTGTTLVDFASFGANYPITFNENVPIGLDIANTFTLDRVLPSTASFYKAGAGTVIVGVAQTYTNPTTIRSGTLSVSSVSGLLGSSSVINLGNVTTTGTLEYTGVAGEVISTPIVLAGTTGGGIISQSGGGVLKIANLTNPGTAGTDQRKTLTLTGSGAGSGELGSDVVNATLGTQLALALTKTGTGTWTLLGANNNYTGATTVSAGTLIVNGALGATAITAAAGATFTQATTGTLGSTATLTANGTVTLAGANSYSGATTLGTGGTLNVNSSTAIGTGTLTLNNGTLNNTSGAPVTLTTNNAVTLAADFAFSTVDGTSLNSLNLGTGAVSYNGNRVITLNGTGTVLRMGTTTSSATSTHTVTVNGSGNSLFLTGFNLSNSGTIKTGIISGNANVTVGLIADGSTSLASNFGYSGTGTLNLTGANTYRGSTTFTNGTVNVTGSFDSATGTALALNSGTLNLSNAGAFSIKTLTVAGGTLNETVANALSGMAALVVSSGTANLSQANSYSGGTTLSSSGTLNLGHGNALGVTASSLTINGGTLNNTSGAALVMTTDNAINLGGNLLFAGTHDLALGAGAISLGSATRTITVTASTLTLGGAISGGGAAVGLTKAGAGTLVLRGSASYTGTTSINAGVLRTAASNALAGGSPLSMGTTAGMLELDGFSQSVGSLAGGSSTAGGITLGSATLTIGGAGTSTSYAGTISGTGSVVKIGSGLQTFVGANTYTGGLVIKAGGIVSGVGANAGVFGTTANSITLGETGSNTNASLTFGSSTTVYNAVPITVADVGSGVVTIGNGNIGNAVTYGGAINLQHELVVSSGTVTAFGGIRLTGAISGTGNLVLQSVGASSNNVDLNGAVTTTGDIILNNASTATGSTILTGSIGNAGNIVLNNTSTGTGVVNLTGTINNTGTISNLSTTAAGTVNIAVGLGAKVAGVIQNGVTKMTLSGASPNFAGYVRINAGTLQLNAAGALNAANEVTIFSGGTYDINGTASTIAGLRQGIVNSLPSSGVATNSTATVRSIVLGGSGDYTFGGQLTGSSLGLTVALGTGGRQTLTGNLTHGAATLVNSGTLALSTGSVGASAITVGNGVSDSGTLHIAGAYTIGTGTAGSVLVMAGLNGAGQGHVSLADGAINTLTINNTSDGALTLGGTAAGSFGRLTFNLGNAAGSSDTITVGGRIVVNSGGAILDFVKLPGDSLLAGSYTLLTSAGGFSNPGGFVLGAVPTVTGKFGSFSLTNDGTSQKLVFSGYFDIAANAYWNGSVDSRWNTLTQTTSNFADAPTGGSMVAPPGDITNVFFSATGVGSSTSTLGQDFTINSLNFTADAAAHTIAPGSQLTLLAAAQGGNTAGSGLVVQAGSADHSINAGVTLGSSQTWTITEATQVLTVGGPVSGAFALTKAGAGKLSLNGANNFAGLTISAGSVQIGNGGTLAASTVANEGLLEFSPGGTAQTVAGVISGSGAVIKSGSGTLTLSGANTYTGLTTVSAGTLALMHSTALGASGSAANGTVVNAGGKLSLSGSINVAEQITITTTADTDIIKSTGGDNILSSDLTLNLNGIGRLYADAGTLLISGNVVLSGGGLFVLQGIGGTGIISGNIIGAGNSLTKSSTGGQNATWILTGNNTYGGNTSIGNGVLQLGDGGTTGNLSNGGTLSVGGTLAINRSNAVTQGVDFAADAITGAGNFRQAGGGVTTLTAENAYTGFTSVLNGTLRFATIGNVAGGVSNLGNPLLANGMISLGSAANTGTLQYTGAGSTSDRVLNLNGTTGGGAIDASGTGLLKFTSNLTAATAGAKSLTLLGTGAGELAGAIVNSSAGATSVVKSGTGTWTLSGTNTYTGGTSVDGGTLVVSGSLQGITTVGSNLNGAAAAVLAGLGTANGAVTVQKSGTLAPGTPGEVGTFTAAGGATFASGSTLRIDIGGLGNSDLLTTSSLSLQDNVTLSISLLNGYAPGGDGSLYVIANPTTRTGVFITTQMNFGTSFGGETFDTVTASNGQIFAVSYDGSMAGSDVVFHGGGSQIVLMAVPEPSAIGNLLLGLTSLAGLQRFRRRTALR